MFSALIPISIGLSSLGRTSNFNYRIILLICSCSFLVDISASIYGRFYGQSNYWIINIYYTTDLILLLIFFYKNLTYRALVIIISITLIAIYIWSVTFLGFHTRPTTFRLVHNLAQILLSLVLYYQFFLIGDDIFLEELPIFWFNTAILVYFSGSFFTYLLSSEILTNTSLTWTLHNISNILKNLLFAIGLWKARLV